MDNSKYIVVDFNGNETIIIFPCYIDHSEMQRRIDEEVISAGFVGIGMYEGCEEVSAHCYGGSTTLKLKSREADTMLANQALRIGNYMY